MMATVRAARGEVPVNAAATVARAGRRAAAAPAAAGRAVGFPPVVDAGVHTLVLGSFPSAASLGAGRYYGHPRNHFWRLMGAVLGEPLADLDSARRLQRLLAHRIGLWDVIAECAREGSLDSAIRDARPNPVEPVLAGLPSLRRVFFNGATAGRSSRWFAARGFETFILPSSSPALTIGFEAKLERWRAIAGGRGEARC
ncbi:MAG: DNA-deoxyinosine glycosylase [bacterium]|jgi:hypoxanthine-DNA glycosylase